MLDQDDNFHLISLSILITCLLCDVGILKGEVTSPSLLEVKGLNNFLNYELRCFPSCPKCGPKKEAP